MGILTEAEESILLDDGRRQVIATAFPRQEAHLVPEKRHLPVPIDCHSYREIMLVLSGSVECMLEDCHYAGTPGSLFLFHNRQRHFQGYPPGTPPGLHLWLFPLPDAFSGQLVRVTPDGWQAAARYWNKTPELARMVHHSWTRCFAAPSPIRRAELKSCLGVVFADVAAQWAGDGGNSRPAAERGWEAMEALTKHLATSLGIGDSIEDMARMTGFSRAHFLRLFRQYAGCTPHEYINRLRMSQLTECLKSGLRRKEIADRLGFSSGAALSHWCRKQRLEV